MFELTQDFGKVDTRVGVAGLGGLLWVAGVAAARRGQDEPVLAEDRKGTLHCHSRDLEARGQSRTEPTWAPGLMSPRRSPAARCRPPARTPVWGRLSRFQRSSRHRAYPPLVRPSTNRGDPLASWYVLGHAVTRQHGGPGRAPPGCVWKCLTCDTARPGAPQRTGGGDPAPCHSPEGLDRKVTSPYAYFEAGQLYLTRERGRDEGDTRYLNFRRN